MVLDAWAGGEAAAPDGSAPGSDNGSHGLDAEPGRGAVFDGASARDGASLWDDDTAPGGGARPGVGALWRSLRSADRPAAPAVDGDEPAGGDVEAFGARHADLVRALLALPGSPPGELTLVVDDRHHLLRCVVDPAGGRLALAVVVAGSPWVVRRVRRHMRQLPDAGLTTGPWLLTWAVGPPPAPRPPAGRPAPGNRGLAGRPGADGLPPSSPVEAQAGVDGRPPHAAFDAWPRSPGEPQAAADGRRLPPPAEPHGVADGLPSAVAEPRSDITVVRYPPATEPPSDAVPESLFATAEDAPGPATDPSVPDPRRGPAPPSALPPARSAGGR
jgi:hypothetical protein